MVNVENHQFLNYSLGFLSVIWVKWKKSVCSITLPYFNTFCCLFLPFFVLEIFKFKYDKVFVRYSAFISKFQWFEQPWVKPAENSFSIASKNQEFELITSCRFKHLISPRPTWNSQWSLISSRYLKRWHHCQYHTWPICQIFFNFSENPENLDMGI